MNRVILFLMLCGVFCAQLYANLPPVLSSVTAAQRTDGSKIVDIYYSVTDAENDPLTVSLTISNNSGATWAVIPTPANLSGDLGDNVTPGSGKHIVWNAGAEGVVYDAGTYRFRITVDDHQLPDQWVYVQGGSFQMGSTTGEADEQPVHQVTLSDFALCDHEVTQAEWQAITGSNPSHFSGYPNRPVEQVSWYDGLRFCNLKSMADNLTPCYTIGGSTNPSDWGAVPTTDNATWNAAICNWNANGYRLPTEAEWEFAARGGNQSQGYAYSGSNDVNAIAWNNSNSENHTWDVRLKQPNELGLYDMSGNTVEWVWDQYCPYCDVAQLDPIGPAIRSSSKCLLRGGGYIANTDYLYATRNRANSSTLWGYSSNIGLRICRSLSHRTIATSDMVIVSGGAMQMGSVGIAEPVHTVTVSSFAMCIHEVTQAEYQAVVGSNPSYFTGGINLPVERVNWYDTIRYCNMRSISSGLAPCYSINGSTNPADWGSVPTTANATWDAVVCNWLANGYRLPTEAEWEFAARGGTNSPSYLYSGSDDIESVAWYASNSADHTHPIEQKAVNSIVTYDMSGNVWEWCWDWYGSSYYSSSPTNNPTGPTNGSTRLVRGGSWHSLTGSCRVANRNGDFHPEIRAEFTGFRVVRSGF